ncbi:MAG TPA: endonuclease III [Dehalococcoidia bacterium]|nr:endonuclease III [Dehalococcoidia bacterium]
MESAAVETTRGPLGLKGHLAGIIDVLGAHYGARPWQSRGRPVDVLIETVLSQNTSDVNSHRAFRALLDRFGSLEGVAAADVTDIEETIRLAGLSRVKSVRIKQILERLRAEHGSLNLEFLLNMDVSAARHYLTSLPGVGPKTASCVLVFSLGVPVFPVDTHVYRVSKRLGLISRNTSLEQAEAELEAMIEPTDRYRTHLHLIEHGRLVCRARKPSCHQCVLAEICPSAFTFDGSEATAYSPRREAQ